MKKKFNLWLNIITICFCVAALAVGVYSATTASITASGKIGFTAHGCDVNVSGYIYGHATGDVADGAPVDAPTSDSNKVKLQAGTTGDSDTSTPYVAEIRGTAGTLKIGNRYFSDAESSDGKPEDIVIVITATNVSKYAIIAEVGTITTPSTAIKASVVCSTTDAIAVNGEVTFTITLTMQKTGNSYSEITMPATNAADNLSIPISFSKKMGNVVTINTEVINGGGSIDEVGYSINNGNTVWLSAIPGQIITCTINDVETIKFIINTNMGIYINSTPNIYATTFVAGATSEIIEITTNVVFNVLFGVGGADV